MLFYRLAHLDQAPFILDEPHFLDAAWSQLQSGGTWVRASPIAGTQGLTYGPTPIWFYGLVQWVFGPSPVAAIAAMSTLTCLSQLTLAAGVSRALRGGPTVFALVLALLAASPYQFFWSRLAWDQWVNICSGFSVGLLGLTDWKWKRWPVAVLGLLSGIAFSSHLMSVLLTFLLFTVVLLERDRSWKGLLETGVLLAIPFLLFTSPYLLWLSGQPTPVGARSFGSGVSFLQRLLQPARIHSTAGIRYFFDDDWERFTRWTGLPAFAFRAGSVVEALLLVLCVIGLIAVLRRNDGTTRWMAVLGLATVFAYPALYAWKGLELQPHYQFPTGWLVPTGAGCFLTWARSRPTLLSARGGLWLVAGLNFAFVLLWSVFVNRFDGTRGIHYSSPVGQTRKAMTELCARSGSALSLANQTLVFPKVLEYLARTLPECRDKSIGFCGSACPSAEGTPPVFTLKYADSEGGRLEVR
ncbi:MAG: hypothetical protein ACT4TC_26430 [Myxococcaceae bacterium]